MDSLGVDCGVLEQDYVSLWERIVHFSPQVPAQSCHVSSLKSAVVEVLCQILFHVFWSSVRRIHIYDYLSNKLTLLLLWNVPLISASISLKSGTITVSSLFMPGVCMVIFFRSVYFSRSVSLIVSLVTAYRVVLLFVPSSHPCLLIVGFSLFILSINRLIFRSTILFFSAL